MSPLDYSDFVDSRFKKLGAIPDDLLHCAVGMMGEWGEAMQAMTRENFLEELGDFDFYLTQMKRILVEAGVRFEEHFSFPMQFDQTMIAIRNHTTEILDLAKKGFIYKKEIPPERYRLNVDFLDHRLSHLCEFMGATRESVRISNVEKLKRRYPEGYSDQAAQARADKGGAE